MKNFIFLLLLLSITTVSYGQVTKSWFDRAVIIGQSMEIITDGKQDPAQFQLTFPHKDTASYLINAGVSILLGKSNGFKSTLTGEYHRNTNADSAQNNFQFGYTYNTRFLKGGIDRADHYIYGDIKYVYDGIDIKNSIAANFLYTWVADQAAININANNFSKNKKTSFYLSPFIGPQIQHVFSAANDSAKGFILRPVVSLSASFAINRIPDSVNQRSQPQPLISFSASYTGRKDIVNSSKVPEGYTQLFKAEADYYIITKPVKLSLGISYLTGSDPIQGLKKQQFWIVSFNIAKGTDK